MRGKWRPVLGALSILLLLSAMSAGEESGLFARSRIALASFLHNCEAAFDASGRDQMNGRVVHSFINRRGQECQILAQDIVIDGDQERAEGTVCRRWNGRWTLWRGAEGAR